MKITGWIVYNGYLKGNKFLDYTEWLQVAASKKGVFTKVWKNNELLSYLTSQKLEIIEANNQLPDFVIFADKDIYLANQLELIGIKVYNSADSIRVSDDKILTYQALASKNLPIPNTIIAPKMFINDSEIDHSVCESAIKVLGLPMILKEAFGSFGEQVYLVHSRDDLEQTVLSIQDKPFIFQEFIGSSYGKDIRLHVVGDQVVAGMVRTASDDFRANITAGGTMQAYQPSTTEVDIAVAATKAINADFAGVDLLFGADNQPIICEINSNAHIRNMYECTGVNVADDIVDYIIGKQTS
ncbi:ATP-grasp domain-containing protein [Virgibacillus sp. DJP39]|uniref:ATP-grasp domain-containing protein n=1 Tax=Virgibacillus sp. DJP39 TaxID=3409790 RepID=UPI003BB7C828